MDASAVSARLSLAYSCIGHTVMHVLTVLYLTVVLELERAWKIDYDLLIQLWTAGSLLVALGAPLAGWLGDRWSDAKMMVAMFVLSGLGAVAAGLADGPQQMSWALALLGLGGSIYHPVGISWIVKNASDRGRAMGINGIFGSVGVAGGALVAGSLTALADWRMAFIVPGLLSLAFGAALTFHIATGRVVDRKADLKASTMPTREEAVRAFMLLSVTMMCGGMIFNALVTVVPKWFDQSVGASLADSPVGVGGLVTLVFLLGALPQFLGGTLADRIPARTVYIVCALGQVPLFLLAWFALGWSAVLVVMLAVVLMNMQIPVENLLLARYTPAKYRGIAYGSKFVLSFGMAPLAVQLVAWAYGKGGGATLVMVCLAGFAAAILLAGLALPRDGAPPRRRGPAAEPALAAGAD